MSARASRGRCACGGACARLAGVRRVYGSWGPTHPLLVSGPALSCLAGVVPCFGWWLGACLARFAHDCRRIVALCVDARREDKGVFHPLNTF